MPILDEYTLDFISHSVEQTHRVGLRLGERLNAGDVVTLSGDVGAGKTTLVIGLCQGWGALDPATSPTFVLVNEYQRADNARLYHLDCYRLTASAQAIELGFDDLLDQHGVMVIEWPEHIQDILPPDRLHITLRWVDESKRNIRIESVGTRYRATLKELRRVAFGR